MSEDNFNWEDVKRDKDQLLYWLRKYSSQNKMSDGTGVPRRTIGYWCDKHNIEYEDYSEFEGELEAKDKEFKPDYEEFDSFFRIYGSKAPEGGFEVEKSLVKEFLKYYCQAGMTKKQVEQELEISRDKLNAMWSAFDITHDSIPFLEEEIRNGDPKELADEYLIRDKKLFIKALERKKKDKAYEELRKYYQKDYIVEKVSEKVLDKVDSIGFDRVKIKKTDMTNDIVLVVNITDWHIGKRVLGSELLDSSIEGYSIDIFRQRKEKLIRKIIYYINLYNPKKIYILNYGDGVDGPNHEVYDGQVRHQDLFGEDQLMTYVDEVIDLIMSVYEYNQNIVYSGVSGNHADKKEADWDAIANRIVKRLLSDFDIIWDIENKKYKIHKIFDNHIIQTHGKEIRTGTYTGKVDVMNIINMAGLALKQTYVIHGHLHHEEEEGVRYKRIMLPTIVGGDELSSDIMNVSARPSQLIFAMSEEGIEGKHNVYFD